MFERVASLLGENNLEKINNTTVLVVGLGGVGGYAVEALVRSGIGNIILIDHDMVDITNLNRQIIAVQENVLKYKTDVMEERIHSISPACQVIKLQMRLDSENISELFSYQFDYLIDACDTILVKELLIQNCLERKIGIISSMGTGNKIDPSSLEVTDIWKTSYDPLAKRIRKYLKDNGIFEKVSVVYSKEQREKFDGDIPSMVFVPATSGLLCANYVIKEIIRKN